VDTVSPYAFDRIVSDHQQRVHRILLALVHDAEAADTLTQEVFLRAFEKRTTFRGEASVGTWLIQIALNLARDHARSRRVAFWRQVVRDRPHGRPTAGSVCVPDPGPSVERTILARERLAAVQAAVDRLSHRQRACFLLRYVESMTVEEIASAMHLRVGTVKAHLARAVAAVRTQLRKWDGSCEDI
jgi:RNA polymerase sigma-70 factor (ECF subfamily)